jgi:hypothetical protein
VDPVLWIVSAGVVAGGAYQWLPGRLSSLQACPGSLYWALSIGLALRLALMIPEPILEIDYCRYLWDGAVINAGYSPYTWTPEQVLSGEAPHALQRLSATAPNIVEQINYPHLTTIYPPVAEAVFAFSNWIKPWDLATWRWIILCFDITTLGVLCAVLKQLDRDLIWMAIYWWNPVVIFQFSYAAHMDVILLPFLLTAFLLALKTRASLASSICLAFATAIKLWPAILLPTFLAPVSRYRTAIFAGIIFILTASFLLQPFLAQALGTDAGLRSYSVSWERNAALFHVVLNGLQSGMDHLGLYEIDAGRILRLVIGGIIILIALGINRTAPDDGEEMARRVLIVISALLLLGPTLYPWYYTWMVPFLAIVPSRALLAFSVVLPLYLLQSHPWIQAHPRFFTDVIVWLEQGPIFVLLFLDWRAARRAA